MITPRETAQRRFHHAVPVLMFMRTLGRPARMADFMAHFATAPNMPTSVDGRHVQIKTRLDALIDLGVIAYNGVDYRETDHAPFDAVVCDCIRFGLPTLGDCAIRRLLLDTYGDRGATLPELAEVMSLNESTLSSRLTPLLEIGFIAKRSGTRSTYFVGVKNPHLVIEPKRARSFSQRKTPVLGYHFFEPTKPVPFEAEQDSFNSFLRGFVRAGGSPMPHTDRVFVCY